MSRTLAARRKLLSTNRVEHRMIVVDRVSIMFLLLLLLAVSLFSSESGRLREETRKRVTWKYVHHMQAR